MKNNSSEENIVYKGKIIEVIQQDITLNNEIKTFEFARRSPGIRLIIKTNKNKFLITKEYRRELQNWDYRLPGGKVFDTLDEYDSAIKNGKDITGKAKEAAIKEAKEEVGINIKNQNYSLFQKLEQQ